MQYNKFLILGGDLRNVFLFDCLKKEEKKVRIAGFSEYKNDKKPFIQNAGDLKKAVANTEVIIGPTPCCSNGLNLNTPFHNKVILITELFDVMTEGQLFIAGLISPEVRALAFEKSIPVFDILQREEMAFLNAIPTAEGAIQVAFETMKTTLHGSNAMILGFGRVSKMLAKMLQGIGANVYVVNRKHADAALIRGYGYKSLRFEELPAKLGHMDVIFNTVPHTVLDKSNLKYIREDTTIIELAAKPFGIDAEEAKKEGLTIIWSPSLPGKVAPITTAKYNMETVFNILEQFE